MEATRPESKETGARGQGGAGAALQTSRLEIMVAWHRHGESWADSRGTDEGEKESRPCSGGWVMTPFMSWGSLGEEEEGSGRR